MVDEGGTTLSAEDIELEAGDRAILVGASRSGKSTLAEWLLRRFRERYPEARLAVFDTKPRWRATRLVDGTNSRKLYRALAKGDTIPDSISCSRLKDWGLAWDRDNNPTQTVIFQRMDDEQENNIRFQVACANLLFRTQRANRPTLAYFDEGMDFYNATSGAKGGSDVIQRMYRSGAERNLASLMGMQRPKGVNIQTLSEMSKAYLFRILFDEDYKRLLDMGWPRDAYPPEEAHVFRYWNVAQPRVAPKARLSLERKAA